MPLDFKQRLGHRLRIAPVVGDFLRVVAGERRLDGFLIEDGDWCRTVAADRFGADVDRRATARTVDRADARGKRLDRPLQGRARSGTSCCTMPTTIR